MLTAKYGVSNTHDKSTTACNGNPVNGVEDETLHIMEHDVTEQFSERSVQW